jgi:hypothetical protein
MIIYTPYIVLLGSLFLVMMNLIKQLKNKNE